MNVCKHLRILVVHQCGEIAAVIKNHIGIPRRPVLEDSLLDTPLAFFLGLTLPGIDCNICCRYARCGMVLGGEDVAGRPAHFSAEFYQRFNEDGGLHGHVDTAKNLGISQWLCGGVFLSQ